ncbi:MAG: response regulator receiver protein, partial [Bacillota bacterium]
MFNDRPQMRVLVVSASQKITELFHELLPSAAFNPIVSASSCGEAKRALIAAEYDIVVINTPLSDEFGTDFALDLAADSAAAVLLLVSAELYGEVA